MTGVTPGFREFGGGGEEGGLHVAEVKKSTSFRTKKRGKVPPRFETLRKRNITR